MSQLPSDTNLKTDSSFEKPQKIYSNRQSLNDIRGFLQEKNILSPRLSSNTFQKNPSDIISKINSHRGVSQHQEFLPFTNERDALGRLIVKSQPGSSINSELELNFKGRLTSRQSNKNIISSIKSFAQFQHSNNILQQVKLAVEKDVIKRQKKKVNVVGYRQDDSLIGDAIDKSTNSHSSLQCQFDKDNHFNINIQKGMIPIMKSHLSLSTNNDQNIISNALELSLKTPRGNLTSRILQDKSSILSPQRQHLSQNFSQSPTKRILIDTKRKDSQPCIGLYNLWNKEKFTLKKTPNIILQDKNDEHQQEKLRQQQEIEKKEKKKVYRYYQKQKMIEREKFIESFTPHQEVKITFPKLKENNKYQQDEFKQLQNLEKLQMKELDEEANFPVHFQEKLNDLKVKAKRIREAIILWNDQNPYKLMKQRDEKKTKKMGSMSQLESQMNLDI